jgi:fumarate reductase flavoprotein subunit
MFSFPKITRAGLAALLVLASLVMTPAFAQADVVRYKAGTYTATADGKDGPVTVQVTFSTAKIEQVVITKQTEMAGLGDKAVQSMADKIQKSQSLAVDVVTGATMSSQAVLDAVENCVRQAGADATLLKTRQEVAKAADAEVTCDVVVVGAGASGTAAALAALERGAQVVLLEKGENLGGAGRYFAEGLLAVESAQQKAAGVKLTVDQAYTDLMEYTHYLSNADLTRTILETSGSTIDWLATWGLPTKLIPNTQISHDANPATYHQYIDKHAGFTKVYASFQAKGGRVFTQTAGQDLLKDAQGRVTGIVAVHPDGSKLTVHAKKVILATGGYAGSADQLAQHMNVTDYFTLAYANNVGDGIRMGLGVGANWQNINTVAVHTTTIPSKDPKIWQGAAASLLGLPLMWVNREGKRFVGEDIVYDFALLGNVAVAQGGAYYTIVDQKTVQELTEKGSPLPGTMERTILVSIGMDSKLASGKTAPMKALPASLDETKKAGFAWKADTLDALAQAIDVDPANLKAAVAQYNQAVATGKDARFLKAAAYLKYPVVQGPFYAVKAAPVVENSDGGLRVNSRLQVLNAQFKPVPNLFAVGCDTGGIVGDSYPIFEGLTLCYAMNSGRLGGYAAADDVKAGK